MRRPGLLLTGAAIAGWEVDAPESALLRRGGLLWCAPRVDPEQYLAHVKYLASEELKAAATARRNWRRPRATSPSSSARSPPAPDARAYCNHFASRSTRA